MKLTFKAMVSEDMADTYQRQLDMLQTERDRLVKQQEDLTKKMALNSKKMEAIKSSQEKLNKQNGVQAPSEPATSAG